MVPVGQLIQHANIGLFDAVGGAIEQPASGQENMWKHVANERVRLDIKHENSVIYNANATWKKGDHRADQASSGIPGVNREAPTAVSWGEGNTGGLLAHFSHPNSAIG